MITPPLTMYCQTSDTPSRMRPLLKTAIISANERAPDAADAADEARPAKDDRGDGVKLVGLAELEAIGCVEPRRLHDPSPASRPDAP
jgi:hypothetical protein